MKPRFLIKYCTKNRPIKKLDKIATLIIVTKTFHKFTKCKLTNIDFFKKASKKRNIYCA